MRWLQFIASNELNKLACNLISHKYATLIVLLISSRNALIECRFGCSNLIILVTRYVELIIVQRSHINKITEAFGGCNKQNKVGPQ